MLERRDADGAVVQADTTLIAATIPAGRAEMQRVRAILAGVADGPSGPLHRAAASMTTAMTDLDRMLDLLESSGRGVGD